MKRISTNHILLVEDNPDDEVLSMRAMKSAGYNGRVTIARDGEDALKKVDANTDIRLVILDMKLPKIDGIEVIKLIREKRGPHLPIVVISTCDEPELIKTSYQMGASSYVIKEAGYLDKCDSIEEVVYYWTLVNQAL